MQRLVRGFLARQRVEGRREALAFLRNACFGVVTDLIDAYISKVRAKAIPADGLSNLALTPQKFFLDNVQCRSFRGDKHTQAEVHVLHVISGTTGDCTGPVSQEGRDVTISSSPIKLNAKFTSGIVPSSPHSQP